jgi:hypothetical protein
MEPSQKFPDGQIMSEIVSNGSREEIRSDIPARLQAIEPPILQVIGFFG